METSITLSARDVKRFAKKLAALNAVAARFQGAVGGAVNGPAPVAKRRRRRVGRPAASVNGRRRGRKPRAAQAQVPVRHDEPEAAE